MKPLRFPEKLKPLKGVAYFAVILLTAHFFWKYTVIGDESDVLVTSFGLDISLPFNLMARHVAVMTHWMLDGLGYPIVMENYNIIRHDTGVAVRIVWACTGLKQTYIFTAIILLYFGSFRRKLWFIPAGWIVLYLFNIFRIAFITAAIRNHPESFEFLHEELFKYLFYALIFLLWILWEERIRLKQPK